MIFVPGIEQCLHEIEQAVFGAAGNDYLFWFVFQIVFTFIFVDDGLLKTSSTVNRGVFCKTLFEGLVCCCLYMFRGIKIRLASP